MTRKQLFTERHRILNSLGYDRLERPQLPPEPRKIAAHVLNQVACIRPAGDIVRVLSGDRDHSMTATVRDALLRGLRELELDILQRTTSSSIIQDDMLRNEATHWRNVANGLMASNDKLKENNAQLTLRIAELEGSLLKVNYMYPTTSKTLTAIRSHIAGLTTLKITFGAHYSPVPLCVNHDKVLSIIDQAIENQK